MRPALLAAVVSWPRIAALSLGLLLGADASAVIQTRWFTATGPGGLTGSGTFRWNDALYGPGSALLSPAALISLSMTFQGGALSSAESFTLAQCTGVSLRVTPYFTTDFNMECDNGSLIIVAKDFPRGASAYLSGLALPGGSRAVVFGAVTAMPTALPVPTLTFWGLGALAGLLAAAGWRRRRAQLPRP